MLAPVCHARLGDRSHVAVCPRGPLAAEFDMYIDNRLVYHGYLRRAPLKPAAGAEAVDFGQAILFSDLPHIVRARACARTLGSIAGNHVTLWKPGKESETVRSSTLATQGFKAERQAGQSSARVDSSKHFGTHTVLAWGEAAAAQQGHMPHTGASRRWNAG